MARKLNNRRTTETGTHVHFRGHSLPGPTRQVQSVQNTRVIEKLCGFVNRGETSHRSAFSPTEPIQRFVSLKQRSFRRETPVATHSVPLRRCSDSHSEAHDMCGSQAQLQKNELSRVLMCIFVDTADVAPTVILA